MDVKKYIYVWIGLVPLYTSLAHFHDGDNTEQEQVEVNQHIEEEVQPRILQHPSDEDGNTEREGSQILPDENDIVVDKRTSEEENVETDKSVHKSLPNSDVYSSGGKNFYSFEVLNIEGKSVQLRKYMNKVSLVVNVASECGFTDAHYKSLVQMQSILASTGRFNILAFPCNQFGAQEPGDNIQIQQFAKEKYQVNFPMFSKIRVLDSDIPEAWQYLQEKSGKVPNWNFWKYLVNEDGDVMDAWGPWTSVEDIFEQVKAAVDRISKQKDPVLPDVMSHDSSEL